MTFIVTAGIPSYRAQVAAHAFEAWRRTEQLVVERWDQYLGADRASSAGAYGAYLTALDAEAAAANRLQIAHASQAAG